jgi:hypothetical protein
VTLFDGIPMGIEGYDYANNPSGFVSIHFAGENKPSDELALALIHDLLPW